MSLPPSLPESKRASAARIARILLGSTLIALVVLPLYRLAAWREAGLAGEAVAELIEIQADFLWSGAFVLALFALLGGLFLRPDFWDPLLRRAAGLLLRPGAAMYALVIATISFGITLWFTLDVMEGKPNLIDAMAQLIQARYMAAGQLAGPALDLPAFWIIPNTLVTEAGWVSQYPPGHTALLAAGLWLGAVSAVGALLMAATAALTYLALRRLLPADEVVARLGGAMTALSPFLISHAGTYMSHGSAAALSSLALYAAVRTRDGSGGWSLLAGAALGGLLSIRPLYAVTIGVGVVLPIGIAALRAGTLRPGQLAGRAGLAVAGAAPLVAALMVYNATFFGGPLQLGYEAAWGPNVGLGFHPDPWGNQYTPMMAVALTSGDLTALSLALLEAPLPLVALVGLWLIAVRRLRPGEGVLLAWALMPVVANFFYWHHGFFMGPRMLTEAAPAWAGLVALAMLGLLRRTPHTLPGDALRFHPRAALATLFVLAGLGAAFLAPLRLVRNGSEFLPSMRIRPPTTEAPSLVFVHGNWHARLFSRLTASGLPLNESETALRQNDFCTIEMVLDRSAPIERSALDLDPRAVTPGLVKVIPYPGTAIRVRQDRLAPGAEGLRLPEICEREVQSDRFGVIDVSPFVWQGDLPGLPATGAMYVDDLGPERNAELLRRYPDREAYLLVREGVKGPLRMFPYEEGMGLLWGGSVLP